MDFDFNSILKDIPKIMDKFDTSSLDTNQKMALNKFKSKTKHFFKDVDLSDVSKIDINSLNLKIEKLKNLTNGFADNK